MTTSVYEFNDHKKFLQHLYVQRREQKKAKSLGYSLALFSESLGFQSKNYAGLVLEGKRNLTVANIHQVARAVGLSYAETLYFEAITLYQQATSVHEKKFYNQRLKEQRTTAPKSTKHLTVAHLFQQWYYPIVLVAADRTDVETGVAKIQKILPLSTDAIKVILANLQNDGLLKKENFVFALNSSHQIFHDLKSSSAAHKQHLGQQLECSKKALKSLYGQGGKFYSHTFSIEREDLPYYENLIRDLLANFTAHSDETNADDVAQLNVQLFRVGPEIF